VSSDGTVLKLKLQQRRVDRSGIELSWICRCAESKRHYMVRQTRWTVWHQPWPPERSAYHYCSGVRTVTGINLHLGHYTHWETLQIWYSVPKLFLEETYYIYILTTFGRSVKLLRAMMVLRAAVQAARSYSEVVDTQNHRFGSGLRACVRVNKLRGNPGRGAQVRGE